MSKEFLRHYPYTFDLDGEPVTVHIKRMTFEESQEFSFRSAELEKTVLEQRIYRREGVEQERDGKGKYKITFEELCQQRLAEMTPEDRDEIETAQIARLKEQSEFLAESIKRFIIHVEPGLIDVHPDGSKHPVIDGTGLLEIIGGQRDVHLGLYQAIFAENHLNARQKKAWRSLAGFSDSSNGHKKDRRGRKRKTTAGDAETAGSATNAAAKSPRNGRSGSGGRKKGRSLSTVAPS